MAKIHAFLARQILDVRSLAGPSQPIITGDRIRIWVGLKMLVPAKSSLEREILPGRILSPRKDWKDSGRNLQTPPVASGNYRLLAFGLRATHSDHKLTSRR